VNEAALVQCPPLSEPDGRISRIRLSEAVLRFASTALGAGFTVRMPFPTTSFPPTQPVPKELKAFSFKVHDSGLLFIQLELPCFQPPL
jgi:hypothetical protein